MENKPASVRVVLLKRLVAGFSHRRVVHWLLVTSKQARYKWHFDHFLVIGGLRCNYSTVVELCVPLLHFHNIVTLHQLASRVYFKNRAVDVFLQKHIKI